MKNMLSVAWNERILARYSDRRRPRDDGELTVHKFIARGRAQDTNCLVVLGCVPEAIAAQLCLTSSHCAKVAEMTRKDSQTEIEAILNDKNSRRMVAVIIL